MSRRYLLIGSGIASLAAAEAIRERRESGTITLVSAEPHPFYSRPGLAYFLDRSLPESSLRLRTPEEVAALKLERVHGRVRRVRTPEHQVELEDGRTLGYDRLLIATGAASIPAPFPGRSLDGVVRLDGMAGAREIARRARPGPLRRKRAVVIGGGSTALEIVEGLVARGVETHYLLRGDRYWSRVLTPGESGLVEDRLRADGVVLRHHTGIARAEGRRGTLRAVVTDDGERIRCDILAVAIGVRPRTELAKASGLDTDRGVLTDDRLRTSAPDVFAAGDVAQVEGGGGLDTLWKSALRQGRTAGAIMAGGSAAYRREVALNVTRLAGITTTVIGAVGGDPDADLLTLTRGQSERWRRSAGDRELTFERGADRIRVHVGERHVTGAVVMGDQDPSHPLVRLIRDEVDIGGLRPRLEAAPAGALDLLLRAGRQVAPPSTTGAGMRPL